MALVDDLMDRSKVAAAVPEVTFTRDPAVCTGADVVIVDLGRHHGSVAAVRAAAPDAKIVGFGAHVDGEALDRARRDGADTVLARSAFFRAPAAALGPTP